jgi:hypothetical protein
MRPTLATLIFTLTTLAARSGFAASNAPALSPACALSARGHDFDLSPLAGVLEGREEAAPAWRYYVSVCGATTPASSALLSSCGAPATFFQLAPACMRVSDAAPALVSVTFAPGAPFRLELAVGGGEPCSATKAREGSIMLECADDGGAINVAAVTEPTPCFYRALVRTPAACPAACPRGRAGRVCSGSSHGTCVGGGDEGAAPDSGSGADNAPPPRCACEPGFSGSSCEVAPSLPPAPSPEPSPPAANAVAVEPVVAPVLFPRDVHAQRAACNDAGAASWADSRVLLLASAAAIFVTWRSAQVPSSQAGAVAKPAARRAAAALICAAVAAAATVHFALSELVPPPERVAAAVFAAPAATGASGAGAGATRHFLGRLAPLPVHVREHQKLCVITFNDGSGGPQALAQLAWTASSRLGMVRVNTMSATPTWDAAYTGNLSVGACTERGDIAIFHEWAMHEHPAASPVKQFIYELGDEPIRANHRTSKHIGHSFYTREFLRLPRVALVRQFTRAGAFPGAETPAEDLRAGKERGNLVLIDDELGPVQGWLEQLRNRHAGLRVVEVRLLNRSQLIGLFREAKVYVDAAMRGGERVAQESMLFHVAPVLERGRNGGSEPDYPLPPSLTFEFARSEKDGGVINGGADLRAKVDAALGDYSGAAANAAGARRVQLEMVHFNAMDLARLLRVTLHVHVLACSPWRNEFDAEAAAAATRDAYVVAAAVHFVAPAASATLHAATRDAASFNAPVADLLAAAADTGGTLAFVRVRPASPLCSAAQPSSAAAAALVASHYGNADVAAILSPRALPLQGDALALWADALRAAPRAAASVLYVRGVALGALFRVDDATPPAFSFVLDAAGALVVLGDAGIVIEWRDDGDGGGDAAHPSGLWLDTRRLASHGVPRAARVEADPPLVDQAEMLVEAGFTLRTMPQHANALASSRREGRSSAAYLCGHVDFRRIASHAARGLVSDLCAGDAVDP